MFGFRFRVSAQRKRFSARALCSYRTLKEEIIAWYVVLNPNPSKPKQRGSSSFQTVLRPRNQTLMPQTCLHQEPKPQAQTSEDCWRNHFGDFPGADRCSAALGPFWTSTALCHEGRSLTPFRSRTDTSCFQKQSLHACRGPVKEKLALLRSRDVRSRA